VISLGASTIERIEKLLPDEPNDPPTDKDPDQ
jgi:hypothetical protein